MIIHHYATLSHSIKLFGIESMYQYLSLVLKFGKIATNKVLRFLLKIELLQISKVKSSDKILT